MLKSNGAFRAVRCTEVVRISEGPGDSTVNGMKELTLRDTIPLSKYIAIVQSSHLEQLTSPS